jgi:hypothetical protein
MTSSTSAGFIVPVKQAESLAPKGGANQPFPTGAAQGTIEETKVRGLPYLAGKDVTKQGYTSEDVEVVSLQIGSIAGLEGQQVGNRKFFTPDIVVRDGEFSITGEFDGEVAWQMEKSRVALANLAVALGQAEEVVTEDGESGYAIANGFVEALLAGEFNGQQLGFVVTHRKYTTKAGEPKVQEQVDTYLPAV